MDIENRISVVNQESPVANALKQESDQLTSESIPRGGPEAVRAAKRLGTAGDARPGVAANAMVCL